MPCLLRRVQESPRPQWPPAAERRATQLLSLGRGTGAVKVSLEINIINPSVNERKQEKT